MRISVNTETEEIEELRHTVAIIEDAIKRRENPNLYEEEEIKAPEQEKRVELKQSPQQPQPEKITVEVPKIEEAKPQLDVNLPEINIPKPISYSQVEQMHQAQKPAPMPSRRDERGSTPDIDISSLSMSNFGEAREGRKMDGMARSSSSNSSFSTTSSSQSPSRAEPRGFEPRTNNKSAVKEIISSLRSQRPGQPIQMSDIVGRAQGKNISESEARNWVSELQKEGNI